MDNRNEKMLLVRSMHWLNSEIKSDHTVCEKTALRSFFNYENLGRNDAEGARNSFRRNVDLPIGFRGFRWVVLKHKTVLGLDDMGKRVNVGRKWTLLRNEFRAPASGAVSRALAENPFAPKTFERSWQFRARTTGREARPVTPEADVLPNYGIQVQL